LYQSEWAFDVLPKRIFSGEEQVVRFRQLLERRVGGKAAGR
jgi:hypothetical protein